MSFVQRKIDVTFALQQGAFTGTPSNAVTLSGLRVSVTIVKAGSAGMGTCQVRIFGLSPSLMQQLSTYGLPANIATGAQVQISAGDAVGGMAVIFSGYITSGRADYSQVPEVAFYVEASPGYFDAINVVKPNSYPRSVAAADVMQSLAKVMGYQFENNGVSAQLSAPYFPGTARDQALACAEAGRFNWIIDNGTLAIWPMGGSRKGQPVMVSPQTGMVGFPTFMQYGVVVKMLMNPTIKYGTLIQVQSSLQNACGMWGVNKMLYELESETPDGAWFLTVEALKPDYVATVNGQ